MSNKDKITGTEGKEDDYYKLGDAVKKVTSSLGLDKLAEEIAEALGYEDCGCDQRQEELNKVNAEKQRYKRKYAPLQESRLKDKAKDIREKLADARRKYHSDEAAAKAALNESIRQKAQFE